MALSGVALGAAVNVNDDGTLSSSGSDFVYTRTTEGTWKYLERGQTKGELKGPQGSYYPASAGDGAIVGYTYDPETGKFTAADIATSVSIGDIGASVSYFSGTVTLGGGDMKSSTMNLAPNTTLTCSADLGTKRDVTMEFGDLTNSSSKFVHNNRNFWLNVDTAITLSGSYTMTEATVDSRELFSYVGLAAQGYTLTFVNDFSVTDRYGNTLVNAGVIDNLENLKVGQAALLWQNGTVSLVAMEGAAPIPEPTTGTLSLLALAGLCIRRRK